MSFEVRDLGTLGYEPAAELQRCQLEDVAGGRAPNTLLLVEHPPVITLGAAFHEENLLRTVDEYRQLGIEVARTERGGDVTYHGPGQLIAYPIFNLEVSEKDLHRWLRDIEEAVIKAVDGLGVKGYRFPPHTGVWLNERKVCAIGIKVRRWVSMHGLALNCNLDLEPFSTIIPCGIADYEVTSLSSELGRDVSVAEVKPKLVEGFREVFG